MRDYFCKLQIYMLDMLYIYETIMLCSLRSYIPRITETDPEIFVETAEVPDEELTVGNNQRVILK